MHINAHKGLHISVHGPIYDDALLFIIITGKKQIYSFWVLFLEFK